jgi:hypothetical protein
MAVARKILDKAVKLLKPGVAMAAAMMDSRH